MTRRPGDKTPEPPGGRAAERLREFIEERFPDGLAPEGPPDDGCDDDKARGNKRDKKRKSDERPGTAPPGAPRRQKGS
jgi:hypothetical protein